MVDVAPYHPHPDGHPERPHTHSYLFDLFQSQSVVLLPLVLDAISALMALVAASGLKRRVAVSVSFIAGWAPAVALPPPRLAAFS
jgi:hypothetical protein